MQNIYQSILEYQNSIYHTRQNEWISVSNETKFNKQDFFVYWLETETLLNHFVYFLYVCNIKLFWHKLDWLIYCTHTILQKQERKTKICLSNKCFYVTKFASETINWYFLHWLFTLSWSLKWKQSWKYSNERSFSSIKI